MNLKKQKIDIRNIGYLIFFTHPQKPYFLMGSQDLLKCM